MLLQSSLLESYMCLPLQVGAVCWQALLMQPPCPRQNWSFIGGGGWSGLISQPLLQPAVAVTKSFGQKDTGGSWLGWVSLSS